MAGATFQIINRVFLNKINENVAGCFFESAGCLFLIYSQSLAAQGCYIWLLRLDFVNSYFACNLYPKTTFGVSCILLLCIYMIT